MSFNRKNNLLSVSFAIIGYNFFHDLSNLIAFGSHFLMTIKPNSFFPLFRGEQSTFLSAFQQFNYYIDVHFVLNSNN